MVERGDVEVKASDAADFSAATSDATVSVGTTVRTDADAIAALELSSGSVVRLNENSRLDVETLGSDVLAVRLVGGEAWSTIVTGTPVKLTTLETRVEAAGSSFDVTHGKDQTTVYAVVDKATVTALDNSAAATKDAASFELPEGSQVTVSAKNLPSNAQDFDAKDIEAATSDGFWFRFNQELDASFAARVRGEPDTTEPSLKVTAPKDNAEVTDSSIEVTGTTDVSATVKVNGKDVDNKLGEFSSKVTLEDGDNTITVTSTDAAGNQAKVTLSVTKKKGKPAAVTVTATSDAPGSVNLSWTKSSIDTFASYKIKRDGSLIKTVGDQEALSYKDSGLEEGAAYSYTVCVVDQDDQETCSAAKKITPKSSPNKPPTVSISAPASGASVVGGSAVTFTAAGNDPESGELTYTWDFGDGVSTTGASVSHTYAAVTAQQTYTVTVTVRDKAGATASASLTIYVTP
ncbi:MAG: PKD domain-containing protein [Candidatus Andersenbacteria bacterium]